MKTRKRPSLFSLLAACTVFLFTACEDWGQMDPIPGRDIPPELEQVAEFDFDADLAPEEIQTFAYPGGEVPDLVADEQFGQVLHFNKGYARIFNPLPNYLAQEGVSLTFWVKQAGPAVLEDGTTDPAYEQDLQGALFSFENENASNRLFFTANGWLSYVGADGRYEYNNPSDSETGLLTPGEWHYVAVIVNNTGYMVYVDGMRKIDHVAQGNFDFSKMVRFMASASYTYIGYGSDVETGEWWIDDFSIYRNQLSDREISTPNKGGGASGSDTPYPMYFNSFEHGLGGATIMGAGSIVNEGGNFGQVFQNGGGAMRTHYLRLPSDVLMSSGETKELTITFWVNAKNAGESSSYMWAPIFTAYGAPPTGTTENKAPALVCQYRGIVAVNTNGADNVGDNWCDYTDAQNDNGVNTLYHDATDWLADDEWHLYTVTFTETTAAVYFDGEVANSWTISGSGAGNTCAIFGNENLRYICLGGNQAWNWADNDPAFMFDDFAVYNRALTQDQIKSIISAKETLPTPIYSNNFEYDLAETTIVGNGSMENVGGNFGTVFQNATGGQRSNYLLLPEDVLMRSGETNQLSITVWVNASEAGASADYMWSPLFTAYGAAPAGNTNTSPMMACQYRGVVMVNTNGPDNVGDNWCDYTDAQNNAGVNTPYHDATDWLADQQWHMYTAVFTPTTAAVYLDGELANAWSISGSGAGNTCRIFGDERLNYICLGGNQAWNWGDPDPGFMFDDLNIYNVALTQEQVQALVQLKQE